LKKHVKPLKVHSVLTVLMLLHNPWYSPYSWNISGKKYKILITFYDSELCLWCLINQIMYRPHFISAFPTNNLMLFYLPAVLLAPSNTLWSQVIQHYIKTMDSYTVVEPLIFYTIYFISSTAPTPGNIHIINFTAPTLCSIISFVSLLPHSSCSCCSHMMVEIPYSWTMGAWHHMLFCMLKLPCSFV
jgi:hypothetical protein